MNENKAKLIAKLVEAKKSFDNAVKDTQGHGYKYANLDQLVKNTLEGLTSQGLIVHYATEIIEVAGQPWINITAILTDGVEEIRTSIPVPLDSVIKGRVPAQEMGKIMTYGRRYSFAGLLNLTADEDTDAAPESKTTDSNAFKNPPAPTVPSQPIRQSKELDLDLIEAYVRGHTAEKVMEILKIGDVKTIKTWSADYIHSARVELVKRLKNPGGAT